MIVILAALVTTVSAQEFRAPIGPQKPVRAMETPPPVSERPKIEGALPKAFGQGRNPLQMLNPWAPARYGIWVENTSFDPNHPGKWNGIKLFEIVILTRRSSRRTSGSLRLKSRRALDVSEELFQLRAHRLK